MVALVHGGLGARLTLTARSSLGCGAWLCLGLVLCLLWEAGGSSASPAHSLLCSGATERGWVGAALQGAGSLEAGAGRGLGPQGA